MALGLSGPAWPGVSTNDCLAQLAVLVGGVSGLDAVYGYRTAKAELGAQAAITSIAGMPGDSPVGLELAYDYIIDVLVKIDGDYAAAETRLNDIVDGIWPAIWGANEPTWSNCYPYAYTQKPPVPQELNNFRRALLYVRVIPN